MKGKIREILNKIKWCSPDEYEEYSIIYTHRGALNDKKEITFDRIIMITPKFFVYRPKGLTEDVFIPFHRILKIISLKDNKVLWEKK
ncbi:MAG: DUF504 domain-containing protein [Candidatus Helarchaeota archaeon]